MPPALVAPTDLESIAAHTFLAMAIVVAAGRFGGRLLRRFGQPSVLGEIIAGICLGPTLLGRLPGDLPSKLFPPEVRPFLGVAAELGLVLFMFMVGLEVDPRMIRRTGRKALAISLSSIVVPFALGLVVLAPLLYPLHNVVDWKLVRFTPFALFIAVSMCATAFAVLARVLSERRMFHVPLGALLISAAAVDDVIAYSLLAVVLAVAASSGTFGVALHLLGLVLLVVLLAFAVRPLVARMVVPRFDPSHGVTPDLLAVLFVGLLVTAYATYLLGLATLVGAFLFGLLMPRDGTDAFFEGVVQRITAVSTTLLLPVFFVVTGLGVDVGGLGWAGLVPTLIIIAVACVGKFAGAAGAARAVGVPRRQALAIGVMMNTRGLAELVILNIGRRAGILDEQVYTMLVIMAVVTTLMAGPLLKRVYPQRWIDREIASAQRAERGEDAEVLVLVDDLARAEQLVSVAADAARSWENARVHLAHLATPTPSPSEVSSVELQELMRSMATVDSLRQRLDDVGLRSRVTVRSTEDRARDVMTLVRSGPALVVVGWSPPLTERLAQRALLDEMLAEAATDVVVVGGEPSTSDVVVDAGQDHSATAAVELAVRLASSRGSRLVVNGGFRAAGRTVGQLRAAGVAASVATDDGLHGSDQAEARPTRVLAAPVRLRTLDATMLAATGELLLVRAADHERPPLVEALRQLHPGSTAVAG